MSLDLNIHVPSGASAGVSVGDSTTDTHFPVIFHDESDGLFDDTGVFTYNPSSGMVTASTFSGSGSGLTTLDGGGISTGTVAAARMAAAQTAITSLRNDSLLVGRNSSSHIDFGTDAMIRFIIYPTERFRVDAAGVDVTGAITATGDITAFFSDKRLKTNIVTIESPLEELQKLSDKNNFINQVVINWESIILDYKKIMPSTSFSIMRIGLVLSRDGGFYKILNKLARFYLLSTIGTGEQWQSWIHVNDVARAFLRNSKESWEGIYNLVTPNPVTNKVMLKSIAKHANRKIIFPKIPLKIVNLILGEMSQIINSSLKVKPSNLKQKKFKYNFINLDQALAHLSSRTDDNMA